MSRTKKQQKIILDFGQGCFVIPAKISNDSKSFGEDIRERVDFATDCIREKNQQSREETEKRRKRRERRW